MDSVQAGKAVAFTHIAKPGSAVYRTLKDVDESPQGDRDGKTALPELRARKAALHHELQSGKGYDPADSKTWWAPQFDLKDRINNIDQAIACVERDGNKPPKSLGQRLKEIALFPIGWLIGLLFRRPTSHWN